MKDMRLTRGLTQGELATLAGMTQQNVSDYENGKKSVERMELGTANRLAKALRVPMERLLS